MIKILDKIDLDKIYPLINTTFLFVGQWRFKKTAEDEQMAQTIFKEWKKRCKDEHILLPKAVYGFFKDNKIYQIVTVGSEVVKRCQRLFAAHKYTDYLYLHGLAVATTEALADYCQKAIEHDLKKSKLKRISPGFPVWPDLSDQKKIVQLLGAEKIGIAVTETYQLVPEFSTSAMIITTP